ncbi:ankyrin repeat and SOCS box protein 2-like isoform X2 [Brachyistius frenatus]|uniref:ankyrin repeat and SOCS box protein 2-like isoform X2 n=1 Tax=Brachyistius frenatus TaxID=100188 RepID=UPI0037E93D23
MSRAPELEADGRTAAAEAVSMETAVCDAAHSQSPVSRPDGGSTRRHECGEDFCRNTCEHTPEPAESAEPTALDRLQLMTSQNLLTSPSCPAHTEPFIFLFPPSPTVTSNMEWAEEDFSVYGLLSEEELLHVAVERSFSYDHALSSSSSSSSSAPSAPTPSNPGRRSPDPPSPRPPPPPPPQHQHVQSCANPSTSLSTQLLKAFNRELGPVESLIRDGDVAGLMDLVRRSSGILTEPDDDGWVALHQAAHYGQLQCVRILVRADPRSVNRCNLKNETALLLAAGRGNVSCVEFLLAHGADLNIVSKDRYTPLYAACERPDEAVAQLLLRSGAPVNRPCGQGQSALHEACRHGRPALCRMLLDAGADLHAKNIYKIQPLFTAAQLGHADVIRLLAEKGADINGQASDGASPVFEASKNGHLSAVQMLLSLKADANRATRSGLLPLHVAVQNNHTRIVSLLIRVTSRTRVRHCGISPLHIAAERNRDEIMELLIESGFDVNAKLSTENSSKYEDRRSTVVYFSVHNGNLEAAEMLLEAGADPNLDVFNPLLIAIRLGWMDMAALLLAHGADVDARISTQPSTFPSAVLLCMESLPMLKLLLDNGCDARPCFDCTYGQKTHPAVAPSGRAVEEMRGGRNLTSQRCIQFCEAISCSSLYRNSGPIISALLDYVSHVHLCSRLLKILESCSDWLPIKLKALPPHPLMQLCRLKIRHVAGARRLKLLHTLPLPARLIRFLRYDVRCSLTC